MTDVTNEPEAFTADEVASDDARYAEMETKFAEKPERAEGEEAASDGEQGGSEGEAEAKDRLSPDEVEKRWLDTKSALKEARAEARRLKAEKDALEEQKRAQPDADELMALIGSLRDDDEDPISDIEGVKKALKLFMARQQAEAEAERTTNARQTQQQRFMADMISQEKEFREEKADYDDAAKYLRESIEFELEQQGLKGDELKRALSGELFGMAQRAMAANLNPAEVAYTLAGKRGYKPGDAKVVQDKSAAVDKAVEKVQTLNKGQQAGRSLSAVGGKSGDNDITPSSVAKLSGKELLEGYKKLAQQEKRAGRWR